VGRPDGATKLALAGSSFSQGDPTHSTLGPHGKGSPGQCGSTGMARLRRPCMSRTRTRNSRMFVEVARQRLMNSAVAGGLSERFTLHDLKRKGGSDFEGDKLMASGHGPPQMH